MAPPNLVSLVPPLLISELYIYNVRITSVQKGYLDYRPQTSWIIAESEVFPLGHDVVCRVVVGNSLHPLPFRLRPSNDDKSVSSHLEAWL